MSDAVNAIVANRITNAKTARSQVLRLVMNANFADRSEIAAQVLQTQIVLQSVVD